MMKPSYQMTLRLPHDVAQRLAASTPSRKRNQFVVDVVRHALDRESRELEEAAQRLSLLEQSKTQDDADWLALDDALAGGEFDEQRFLQERKAKDPQSAKAAREQAA